MELCYYWIDNYNNFIKKQGINFGGEFVFEYLVHEQKLIVRKNKTYIKKFFNTTTNKVINNVTAIVGRNGVGKSTLIHALKGLLLGGGILGEKISEEEYKFYKRILIFKNDNQFNIFFHKDLIIEHENETFNIIYEDIEIDKYSFKPISYGTLKNSHYIENNRFVRVNGTEKLSDTDCIFFSNTFDSNYYTLSTMLDRKYYDLSNRGLLNEMEKQQNANESSNFKVVSSNHLHKKDTRFSTSILNKFLTRELENKLLTLSDKRSKDIIQNYMSLPEKLVLNLDYILYRSENFNFLEIDESSTLRFERVRSQLNKAERLIYNKINEFNSENKEKLLAKQTYFYRIIDAYFDDMERFVFFDNHIEILNKEFEKENINSEMQVVEILDIFSKFVVNTYGAGKISSSNKFNKEEFFKLTDGYVILIQFIDKLIDNDNVSFIKGQVGSLRINKDNVYSFGYTDIALVEIRLNEDGINLANQLLHLYKDTYTATDFIKFIWDGISSGEDALFSIISRFYSLKDMVQEDVVIFLDEGELYLHPEWQRKYIDIILSYISYIYSEVCNVQIIISTNSPLLISDLPKNNIIFLDKKRIEYEDLEGKCKVVNNINIQQTFAANIHNLMVHGFFMESTIGEFSIRKTNEIIRFLQMSLNYENPQQFTNDAKEITKIIDLIGEPVIKRKFENMLKYKIEKFHKEQSIAYYKEKFIEVNLNNNLDELEELSGLIQQKITSLKNKDEEND